MIKFNESGQMLILVFIALGVMLFTVLFVISGAQLYFQNASYSANTEKVTALAEAGVDKALASLNKTGGSYNGETETVFGDGVYSVAVIDKGAGIKVLNATGYIPNKASPKVKKTISVEVSTGIGLSFVYGLQIGEGGLEMGNGALLNGSVYSNGNITGGNTTRITGDVYVAGVGQISADQQSDCFGANCQDYVFGRSVGGENRLDVAQSFKPSAEGLLNKVSIKLKKVGSPANPTVRIMRDNSGKPDKNGILATGTLSANLVTSQYSLVDVTFNTSPGLNENTTYWIMVNSQALDNSNYWVWSNDLAQGYTRGVPKWSVNWQAGNPVWNAISGDLGFQTYMGGGATSLNLTTGSIVEGNVYANTITGNMTISKNAYYQTIGPSITVQGTKFPGSADPPPTVFPVSDANITEWKNQAEAGGVTNGNINGCTMTLGPRKIIGNLTLENSCIVTVKAPLWVTGNIITGNSTVFVLDSSFGATSGVIVVEGTTVFGNNSDLKGSGTAGSYLMLVSTYDSSQNGNEAIETGNSSISGIVYAPKGTVELANGASFKEITAWKIELGNSAVLTYDSGLASTVFSAGPSGSFSLNRGTYQVK
ncbi:hypothetical protein A3D83_04795 [Candidatus Daviesbacteria bacterium RIFCSPHIGHO2_02_FULL_41_10]|uniref:Type 4 fimbrial biogenesis protein PilX N-terminal domain-containing protein n=2 Tax=Candidatus Daviesiibacteriota TaxID=1752718 RepID=A0A1F5ISU0_9BACT|nr:MAG: hypothetical protein A2871_00970 [Candidatus Daviesbacteria bacterium RIFCSPHIGHO2_01_FULL_41_23]OGE32954.1 MAG: hypothetical protein A3D83_04795 [Candidatus Daviesbacteria bacterium RIFCSPHIGHO2_02_FULL_41_10]OGE62466.1 MAG: hypothetical protein A2967_01455 [Candidatus Daviesbacteria bacterium RIFCSPLOWO2_01_FULL_41_32]